MTESAFESERYFTVWQYSVSHCRLLLRSSRSEVNATRIDVHFGGVAYMLLKPTYDGLSIRLGSAEERAKLENMYDFELGRHRLYVLDDALRSFVVSGPMQWHEDEGDHRTPSKFGGLPGTP